MQYRPLGKSGLQVSPLCLGTMMFGGQTDEYTVRAITGRALEQGINFIDTANVYNDGRSEEVVGRLVSGKRDKWVLATEFGGGPATGGWPTRAAPRARPSLGRSQPDTAGHRPYRPDLCPSRGRATRVEETIGALGDLIRAGRVPITVFPTIAPGRSRNSAILPTRWAWTAGGQPAALTISPTARSSEHRPPRAYGMGGAVQPAGARVLTANTILRRHPPPTAGPAAPTSA
jgi:hypothetical protein